MNFDDLTWGHYKALQSGSVSKSKETFAQMRASAATFDDFMMLHSMAPSGREKKEALEQALSLATTYEDWMKIYWLYCRMPDNNRNREERMEALGKANKAPGSRASSAPPASVRYEWYPW